MKNKPRGPVEGVEKYTLRHYDSFDGYWIDIKTDISYNEAFRRWLAKTEHGTKYATYSHGAYFDIFPADTKMLFR